MIRAAVRVTLLTVFGGLLSACAARPTVMEPDVAALAAPLATGMTEIRDKAVDQPDVDQLFTAALTGLSALDHTLRFETNDDALIVRHGEMIIARTNRPQHQDIGEWVANIQTLIAAARRVSPALDTASSETLLQSLFNGIMPLLDRYSRYAGRDEAARNRTARNGFVGLGFDLQQAPLGALVRSTLKDGPADRAGMISGDIITHVDGVRLAGLPLAAILHRFDGAADTVTTLTVDRDGMSHAFAVRRALIIPETVAAETNDSVLYLKVKNFNVHTAAAMSGAISDAGPIRGIILDLRGDPGGLLDQAVAVADLFLDHGVIANLRGRDPAATQFYAATPGDIAPNIPIVLLVDGVSASAAEILAAALQENNRAIAVGTASVGKGTVQILVPLPNDGELALTWARVFTPNGTLLNERGILPDICTSSPPIGPPESAGAIIAATIRARAKAAVASPLLDVKTARSACRPEPRPAQAVDLEVARRWIADPSLRGALGPHLPTQFSATH
ncbi:MAG: PDZ domain-containing protein [Rhodospirillaceae bacterium]|nr:MAG: PDZ domain-containing protein [Rhodospirillaceae bacterium]